MVRIFNDKPGLVISFSREKNGDKVIPIFNFSDKPIKVKLSSKHHAGAYRELFTGKTFTLKGDDVISLDGWGFLVLVKYF
jgi:cyclomaltodextrinase / maltogenic alpha-amylase / neopullulanase